MRRAKVKVKAKVKAKKDPTTSSSTSTLTSAVTYTLVHEGNFYVIEHVPARVCRETVERIHALVKGKRKPDRTVRTPVYEYA